jgi:peptidoglycan/LPS O-acetylase OafA/YrhL
MPGIDALRAIAVLAVFFYHTGAGWMPGGFLGVDVFFVISGYLITSLLLSEIRERDHIRVIAFWLRRARRLLPAVAVMIAVTLVVAALLIPSDVPGLRGDALSSLFYVNNWHLIFTHQSYFQAFGRPSLFRHLWSLSVEEQFYLIWPLVFAAGMTLFGRKRLLLGVIAGVFLSTLLMLILFNPEGSTNRVFYGTDTRAVGLLVGVALAMLWHPNDLKKGGIRAGWWLDALGVFALFMVLRDLFTVQDFEPSLYRGGFLLLAIWTGLLVAVLAHPAARLGRILGNRPMVWLGLRSYSFYLWHWPILMLTRPHLDVPLSGPPLVILQLAATLLLADLSYRYVEQPFRHRRDSASAPSWLRVGRPALAAGVLATVFLVGWSGLVSTSGNGVQSASAQPRIKIVKTALASNAGHSGRPAAPSTDTGQAASVGAKKTASAAAKQEANARAAPKRRPGGERGSGSSGKSQGGNSGPVLAIGDSVMLGAATDLAHSLGGSTIVNAKEGRQATEYPGVIGDYRKRGQLPESVVIQVGNNGPVYSDELSAIRTALAGVDHVYFVNVEVPRSWQDEVNGELDSFVKSWPQAKLIDWYDTVQGDMTYDGIHLNPDGQRTYTNLIANAVRG